MPTWHWIMRGCAAEEIIPGCGTCGYPLSEDPAGGICPECGVPYIPSTLRLRGPSPPPHWYAGWIVGPVLLMVVCGWAVVTFQEPVIIAGVGLILVVTALLQTGSLDWVTNHTYSDRDRRSLGAWCITAVWTIAWTLNAMTGVVLLPLGVIAAIMD